MKNSTDPKLDDQIVICGGLLHYDLIIGELLTRYGLNCVVIRHHNQYTHEQSCLTIDGSDKAQHPLPAPLEHLKKSQVITIKNAWQFYKTASKAKLLISITGSLSGFFGHSWFLTPFIPLPPTLFFCTGSDLGHLLLEKSIHGRIFRALQKKAKCQIIPFYPQIIENVITCKLKNCRPQVYPYLVQFKDSIQRPLEGPITYLHSASITWQDTYPSKGSDRFIRGFINAVKKGANARCIILDRGPQRQKAREIIDQSGVSDHFEWHPQTTQKGLADLIQKSDVLADQFDIGGFGSSAMEAMALGCPVMIHINPTCQRLAYQDAQLPILNCQTETDIEQMVLAHQDHNELNELGRRARQFVHEHHSVQTANFDDFIFTIYLAAGIQYPIHDKVQKADLDKTRGSSAKPLA